MTATKYLLREYFSLCDGGQCKDFLNEEDKKYIQDGGVMLTGVAQRADAKNGNNRVYPERVLRREVENYKKLVRESRALGQLDHSDESIIELEKVSHIVTDIWFEGKDVMVKMKLLSTPNGEIAKSLVRDGVAIGLSSRGLGSVNETKDGLVVEDDFALICFDLVGEPSTQGAFMHLTESKTPIRLEKSDRIFRSLNEVLRKA